MHILDYVAIGSLIVCMLIAAAKALSLGKDRGARAETRKRVLILTTTASILAWGAISAQASQEQTPSSQANPTTQPSLSPIFQEQNKDSALERLREAAEEEKDLLNILD